MKKAYILKGILNKDSVFVESASVNANHIVFYHNDHSDFT